MSGINIQSLEALEAFRAQLETCFHQAEQEVATMHDQATIALRRAEDDLRQAEDDLQHAEGDLRQAEENLQHADGDLRQAEENLQHAEDDLQHAEDDLRQQAEENFRQAKGDLHQAEDGLCQVEVENDRVTVMLEHAKQRKEECLRIIAWIESFLQELEMSANNLRVEFHEASEFLGRAIDVANRFRSSTI